MKTDIYTKVILTIIAFALTANLIKGLITPAMAENKKFATVPLNSDGSIKVRIVKDGPVDVNISTIDGQSLYNANL